MAVTDNPISRALVALGAAANRSVDVLDGPGALRTLAESALSAQDAVVLCDHDAPSADEILRYALAARVRYVAMLASRSRAGRVRAELADELPAEQLAVLHMPAGLNIGGRAPGEIALSLLAEIVAAEYDRPGGPMAG